MARKGVRELRDSVDKAVRTSCHRCELKSTCARRKQKQVYESLGWNTKCILVPKRKKK